MTLVQNDLWCYILRRPTEGPRLLAKPDLLGKAKVNLKKYQYFFLQSDNIRIVINLYWGYISIVIVKSSKYFQYHSSSLDALA